MNKIYIVPLIFIFIFSLKSLHAEEWMGYSIKKSDYSNFQGDERIPYMIFLDKSTYNSKSECYDQMVKSTPLTRASPYMVNCVQASKIYCYEQEQQILQIMEPEFVNFGSFQMQSEFLKMSNKDFVSKIDRSIVLFLYVAMHEEDPDFPMICRQKVFDKIKQKRQLWVSEGRIKTEQLINDNDIKKEKIREIVEKQTDKYVLIIKEMEKIKENFLKSGGEFFLDFGSPDETLTEKPNIENEDIVQQNICYFGADADYSIDSSIDYVNQRLKDYNCKKGDIIDFRMQDGWNAFPQMFIDSACDFKFAITKDRYTKTYDDGYEDKITVFSCIYKGKHTDYRFNCDYDWNTDKCVPR